MAGALSESAPRPVSVVRVEGGEPSPNNNPPPAVVVAPVNLDATPAPPTLTQEPSSPPPQTTVTTTTSSTTTTTTTTTLSPTPAATELNQQQTPNAAANNNASNGQQQQQPVTHVRSFASTEAQTELSPQLLLHPPPGAISSSHVELLSEELRDARRRERRMRRQHRRAIQRANGAAAAAAAAVNGACAAAGLPPTYPGLMASGGGPGGPTCAGATALPQGGVAGAAGGAVPLVGPAGAPVGGFLHPPPPHLGLRGLSLGLPFPVPASVSAFGRDAVPKQCCGLGSPPVRWSILGVGVVGLVCAGAGALLGALRATGRDHIAVALLMIGIGVVLVTVSAVAWRVTSRENCGGFFGLTGISGRIPPARPMHPYAAMIYPEFQFRTPPPSYQASMQEYRLRLLLLDRLQPTSSPPPTYRSNAGSCVAGGPGAITAGSGINGMGGGPGVLNGSTGISGAGGASHHHQSIGSGPGTGRDSRPPSYCGHRVMSGSGHHQGHQACSLLVPSKKDANLVRIVQTESEPVILSGDQTPPVTAVEVLAHL